MDRLVAGHMRAANYPKSAPDLSRGLFLVSPASLFLLSPQPHSI